MSLFLHLQSLLGFISGTSFNDDVDLSALSLAFQPSFLLVSFVHVHYQRAPYLDLNYIHVTCNEFFSVVSVYPSYFAFT